MIVVVSTLSHHPLFAFAFKGRVEANGTRDSTLEILVGDDGWVDLRENGILYSFNATKCMFSWGNLSEKLRMGNVACENEVVVDLFAGIGYFTLPFLVRYATIKQTKEVLQPQMISCSFNSFLVSILLQGKGKAGICL